MLSQLCQAAAQPLEPERECLTASGERDAQKAFSSHAVGCSVNHDDSRLPQEKLPDLVGRTIEPADVDHDEQTPFGHERNNTGNASQPFDHEVTTALVLGRHLPRAFLVGT